MDNIEECKEDEHKKWQRGEIFNAASFSPSIGIAHKTSYKK